MKILLINHEHEMQVSMQLAGPGMELDFAKDLYHAGKLINIGVYELIILNPDLLDFSAIQLFDLQYSINGLGGTLVISTLGKTIGMLTRLHITLHKTDNQTSNAMCLIHDGKSMSWPQVVQEGSQKTFNEISFDNYGMRVWVRKKLITLTKREFDLLVFFINHKNEIISSGTVIKLVWTSDQQQTAQSMVYTHIKNLKRKLTTAGAKNYFQSFYAIGYRFGER